jgi:hypothetical protein
LNGLIQQDQVTLFMLLVGFRVLLMCCRVQSDISVGTPGSG